MSGHGVYSIGAVSRTIGVPVATIRSWEERYGVVRPERSSGGHRLYTRREVDQLRYVAQQVASGSSPGDAHRLLRELIDAGSDVAAPVRDGAPLMVLLAERDPFAAEFAEFFLRSEGFETVIALDAADARSSVRAHPPAAVVIDLLISGGDGLALCAEFARGGVPVVAVSSLDSRDDAIAAGADVFLRKPVAPLTLVSAVNDVRRRSLEHRRPARTP